MNQLSVRFFVTNIFTCIWVIYNSSQLKEEHDTLSGTQNVPYGLALYTLMLAGVFFSWVKARDLAYNKKHSLNTFERILLVLLYLFALLSNSILAYIASSYLFGGDNAIPEWFKNTNVAINLIVVGFVFAEAYVLAGEGRKKKVSDRLLRLSNFILPLYTGIAIGVAWNVLLIGSNLSLDLSQHDIVSETIAACVLVMMIVLPFQRLLWFEVFSESKGWKTNLQVAAGLLSVVLCAIIPLFF